MPSLYRLDRSDGTRSEEEAFFVMVDCRPVVVDRPHGHIVAGGIAEIVPIPAEQMDIRDNCGLRPPQYDYVPDRRRYPLPQPIPYDFGIAIGSDGMDFREDRLCQRLLLWVDEVRQHVPRQSRLRG